MLTSAPTQWPSLDYHSWKDTLATLHQWIQIVGKIRLRTMPWQNHSWHATLYVSPRGFTTGSIPYRGAAFQLDFDFINHRLTLQSTHHPDQSMNLFPRTVASFHEELFTLLDRAEIPVEIHGSPNELEEAIPFHLNEKNAHYDGPAVKNFWEAMIKINEVFTQFRSQFIGKCSPVHLFWGAFDLAVTRFSGRPAPLHPGGMPNMPLDVMQEAYSHEVSSAGFWPGADTFPEPVFYAYCYPTPEAFSKQGVLPEAAFYSEEMGEFFLKYSDVVASDDPAGVLMDFLESTYAAAANTGEWDRKALERPAP
ncbi:DUF5996 family protein [Lewinella sp. W8]|uniref:DUF5996 family protein n=1 Tax=Lewinella sp. W8 TaxID=2528208 RepID=UPI0010687CAC|nr:DUF5996 family protein [Lewinella sp. W8]MTB52565.1 hypothetical protein [Lewinella sp. W8]